MFNKNNPKYLICFGSIHVIWGVLIMSLAEVSSSVLILIAVLIRSNKSSEQANSKSKGTFKEKLIDFGSSLASDTIEETFKKIRVNLDDIKDNIPELKSGSLDESTADNMSHVIVAWMMLAISLAIVIPFLYGMKKEFKKLLIPHMVVQVIVLGFWALYAVFSLVNVTFLRTTKTPQKIMDQEKIQTMELGQIASSGLIIAFQVWWLLVIVSLYGYYSDKVADQVQTGTSASEMTQIKTQPIDNINKESSPSAYVDLTAKIEKVV